MKRLITSIILLLIPLIFLSAQGFETYGYRVLSERSESGIPTYDIADGDDNRFSVSMEGDLNRRRADVLQVVRSTFFAFPGLEIQRLRVVFEENSADIAIVPRTFVADGNAYHQYMPSGMHFTYTEYLEYDFRMRVGNLFLRMNGQFIEPQDLLDRLATALKNPALFVQSQDPQYLFGRLDAVNEQIDQLRFDDRDIREESDEGDRAIREESDEGDRAIREESDEGDRRLEVKIDEYATEAQQTYAEVSSQLQERFSELEEEIEARTDLGEAAYHQLLALHEELLAAHESLLEAHEVLREEFDSLLEANGNLQQEFETARDGGVVLFTRSLFGSIKALDEETIAAIVDLRSAEPDLPYADAASRVSEQTGIKVDKKHALAVYALYFNDFD